MLIKNEKSIYLNDEQDKCLYIINKTDEKDEREYKVELTLVDKEKDVAIHFELNRKELDEIYQNILHVMERLVRY